MADLEKMNGESLDISEQRKKELKLLFPGAFTETTDKDGNIIESVDFEKLKAELGTFSDIYEGRRERYGMDWPGKRDCMKLIQEPTRATLKPCREESVDFDTTGNLFIEGDNLEVLKLMQKAYYCKIKMIYIDPPYNTGKEFIYPDNYKESLETYLAYAGLIDDEGKKFSTNTASEGRFHTRWLNMMYPRLYLARNLLREDGVIFISIDDNEVENLRRMCDEIFGEENALIPFIWHLPRGINAGHVSRAHEYILGYARNKEFLKRFSRDGDKDYSIERCNKKIDARHPASIIEFPAGIRYEGQDKTINGVIEGNESIEIIGELVFKNGRLDKPVALKAGWTMKQMIIDWINKKEVFDTKGQKIEEFFFKDNGKLYSKKIMEFDSPKSVIINAPDSQIARRDIEDLLGSEDIFDYPKPYELIRKFIRLATNNNDICLDFFAGSCPTPHAVFKQNIEDKLNRRFIVVQLPEKTDETGIAYEMGYKTVSELGKERIRRVAKKIRDEIGSQLNFEGGNIDLGFKVLKLNKSNFKQWQSLSAEETSEKEINEQLDLHVDHIDPTASSEDLLCELLIKAGFMPTEKIEQIILTGKSVYSIANGALLICLEKEITPELIDAVADKQPAQFICLDAAFKENDQLKANAVQTFKSRSRDSETGMVFRVV